MVDVLSETGLSDDDINRRRRFAQFLKQQAVQGDLGRAGAWGVATKGLLGVLGGWEDRQAQKEDDAASAAAGTAMYDMAKSEYNTNNAAWAATRPQAAPTPAPTAYDSQESPTAAPALGSSTFTMPHSAPRATPELLQRQQTQESGNNPAAVSPVGAQGLRQIMPATAGDPGFGVTPAKYASGSYDANNPADVTENQRIGTDYLNAHLKRYNGDTEAALVAYNAGPALADKWMASGKRMPLPAETRDYVKKIMGGEGQPTQVASNEVMRLEGDGTTDVADVDPAPNAISPEKEAQIKKLLANPRISPAMKAAYLKLLFKDPYDAELKRLGLEKARKDLDDRTPDQQEYDDSYAKPERDAGRVPKDFTTWNRENKAAGRQAITIDQKGETKFSQDMGAGYAKMALDTVEGGNKALGTIQKLQVLDALTSGVETGRLAGAQATVGAWAQALGLDPTALGIDPKLVITADTLPTVVNSMTIGMIGPGGMPANNFSEADRKFLVATQPQLYDQPQARAIKTKILLRMEELKIEKANALQDMQDEAEGKGEAFGPAEYQKFENKWRRQQKDRSVFGDIIEEYNAMPKAPPSAKPTMDDIQAEKKRRGIQ
jgi:soluble lytic murein transglycosylase-like protein